LPFNQSFPEIERVNLLLKWLDYPITRRASFYTIYFDTVDTAGHLKGVENYIETGAAMKKVDDIIKTLLNELEKRQHLFDPQILIVSDHGMSNVSKSKVIVLNKLINEKCLLNYQLSYSITSIWPLDGDCHNMLINNLTGIEHLKVYEKRKK